jgi:hypothetical protein
LSETTTTTVAPPSPEELTYLNQQTALATLQMEALKEQQAFTADYQTTIKPVIEAQAALMKAELDAANDPVQKAIAASSAKLQLAQLEQAGQLLPLQKQLLEKQIAQMEQGYKATPEQIKLIDETVAANLAKGESQILDFSKQALIQLRDELAPSLGLRPTDTPILDRGDIIGQQAVRQQGQLASSLQAAGAEAKLNYPLAAAGVSSQASQFSQNLILSAQQLAGQLTNQATANRLQLAGMGTATAGSAIGAGLGLAAGSESNPLSFGRGGTSKVSGISGSALVGGIGSALGGFSDERLKSDIKTIKHDEEGRRWVTYRYIGEPTSIVRVGVIAQEVFLTDPDAVAIDESGFLTVDYSKLGEAI